MVDRLPSTEELPEASQDEARAQLDRILTSAEFDATPREQSFLKYVVGETLDGRASRIKAYTIAVEVFGRSGSFDSQNDPIVRIEASHLRRSLERYYLTAGRSDPIVISIPKGGYVPIFARRQGDGARSAPAVAACRSGEPWRKPAPAGLDRRRRCGSGGGRGRRGLGQSSADRRLGRHPAAPGRAFRGRRSSGLRRHRGGPYSGDPRRAVQVHRPRGDRSGAGLPRMRADGRHSPLCAERQCRRIEGRVSSPRPRPEPRDRRSAVGRQLQRRGRRRRHTASRGRHCQQRRDRPRPGLRRDLPGGGEKAGREPSRRLDRLCLHPRLLFLPCEARPRDPSERPAVPRGDGRAVSFLCHGLGTSLADLCRRVSVSVSDRDRRNDDVHRSGAGRREARP